MYTYRYGSKIKTRATPSLADVHCHWTVHVNVRQYALPYAPSLTSAHQIGLGVIKPTSTPHVQPTSLSLNPLHWCPTHLTSVELTWLVSLAGVDPVHHCGVRFAVVKSTLSCWNLLCHGRGGDCFGVTKSASSGWNPCLCGGTRVVMVESASLALFDSSCHGVSNPSIGHHCRLWPPSFPAVGRYCRRQCSALW